MSALSAFKMFEAMPEQIKKIGGYTYDINSVIRWIGTIDSAAAQAGLPAMVLDIDASTWADGNRRVIIVAQPAWDHNKTAALMTQSHAAGQYLFGSYRFRVYSETPESHTGDQAKFMRFVQQALAGQLGAPMELLFGDNDVQPRVSGVQGASAANETTSNFVSAGWVLPYGMVYPGGV